MGADPKDHPQLDLLGGPAPKDEDPVDDEAAAEGEAVDEAAEADAPKDDDDDAPADEGDDDDEVNAFDEAPTSVEAVTLFTLDQVGSLRPQQSMLVGAVLGGAIGDAMGHPTEFLSMSAIHSKYGPDGVKKFELYWDRGGKHFAPYTDDTQMAEAVLRALLESRDQGLDATMNRMAQKFIDWADHPQGGHRAPGNACMAGCRALKSGSHWSAAGGAAAGGCGSVMRAYPFGLVFANDLDRAERWAVAHSKLTHRDPIALAACAAMAVGMALVVRGESVKNITSAMVAAACRYSASTAAMMAQAIDDARKGVGPEETLDRLRAWAAHEAIAAAVYIFERHPDDARAAILEGANTPGDSDSIATLAGALVGGRVGAAALPAEWIQDVERGAELASLVLMTGGARPFVRENP